MSSIDLKRQQIINVALSFFLLLFACSYLSFNIFIVPLEQAVPSFTSKWTRALGLAPAIDVLGTFYTASVINVQQTSPLDKEHPLTRRIKYLTVPTSACFLLLMLIIPAMKHASNALLYLAVIPQTIPFVVFYLISVRALMDWIPKHPAWAMTFVSASFGVSQFVLSPLLYSAISVFGLQGAFVCTGICLCACILVCGLLLRFPSTMETMQLMQNGDSSDDLNFEELAESNKNEPLDCIIRWGDVVRTREFYNYVGVLFLGRTGIALFPYFFKIGSLFNISTPTVVAIFQILSVSQIVWSVVINSFFEYLSKYIKSPVRPLLAVIFISQALLYASLIPVSVAQYSILAMIIISLIIIMLESQTAYAVILAQDTFGVRNGVAVYSIATGIATGPGEGFFTTMMSIFEERFSHGKLSVPTTYAPFYVFAGICLLIGGILVCTQRKCHKLSYDSIPGR